MKKSLIDLLIEIVESKVKMVREGENDNEWKNPEYYNADGSEKKKEPKKDSEPKKPEDEGPANLYQPDDYPMHDVNPEPPKTPEPASTDGKSGGESEAAEQAHKLGLISIGWGCWADKSNPKVTIAKTVKGKLVKVSPTDDHIRSDDELEGDEEMRQGLASRGKTVDDKGIVQNLSNNQSEPEMSLKKLTSDMVSDKAKEIPPKIVTSYTQMHDAIKSGLDDETTTGKDIWQQSVRLTQGESHWGQSLQKKMMTATGWELVDFVEDNPAVGPESEAMCVKIFGDDISVHYPNTELAIAHFDAAKAIAKAARNNIDPSSDKNARDAYENFEYLFDITKEEEDREDYNEWMRSGGNW